MTNFPQLGFGLGLRPQHYPHIWRYKPKVDWFEIISENFMDTDGLPKRNLAKIKERYPIVMHGVAMSIGTVDPLNSEYLQKLKALIDWVNPAWISDHLCWTGVAHKNSHDLLPVPYTEEALKHIVSRIKQVQDFLGRPIALENPSTYLEFTTSHISESEFMAQMVKESGCNLLLDVNNVYVTCFNHRLDPQKYIDALPLDRVIQIHLSGHTNKGTHIIDTHDDHVVDEVWQIYKYVIHKAGRTPNTMVEWDGNIPSFPVLNAELKKAKRAAKNSTKFSLPKSEKKEAPYSNFSTPLLDSQIKMQKAIFSGDKKNAASWIRSKKDFAPQNQLGIYVDSYRWRLIDVVAEDYPVLKRYLGAEKFNQLINDFVDQNNSDHFNIGRFAIKLPKFLVQKKYDKFAIELCELETAIAQLADAEETEALTSKDLEKFDAESLENLILQPRAALKLFAFDHATNRYYLEEVNEVIEQKTYLAVFRHDDVMWRIDLEHDEFSLLQKLFNEIPLSQALSEIKNELQISEEQLEKKLSNWFSRWIRNFLLKKITQQSESATIVE